MATQQSDKFWQTIYSLIFMDKIAKIRIKNVRLKNGCHLHLVEKPKISNAQEHLLDMFNKIKNVDVTGIAICFVTDDNCTHYSWSDSNNAPAMIASMAIMKHDFIKSLGNNCE